ncbi:MAG: tetratricopeptide repeat protein [Calditrichaceae bacterium]|nr:tetratricopeptide repeat protein [Calditrichaceae bacterium]RQV97549.1 MAG: hypothetical protein EH224_00575 [Calditrichota bacterium]
MKPEKKPLLDKSSESNRIKKTIFFLITIFIPVLFFVFLEIGLRLFDYGGDHALFIDGPEKLASKYWRINPNAAGRFFFMQSTIPSPVRDLFLKKKPANGYRIFILGGSTAAGFPYNNNLTFSRILEKRLQDTYPQFHFEVVNTAMSAINTYALLDFLDEVFEHSPDLILIYAGHNEYYGAMGVGSLESLGNSRNLVKMYLKLRRIKTVLLLRSLIGNIKKAIHSAVHDGSGIDPSQSLMARIVGEQTIPLNSAMYQSGCNQFRENFKEIIERIQERNIPLLVGDLVCNLRDQVPFISVKNDKGESADDAFKTAWQLVKQQKTEEARKMYVLAKDMDALRFRAPSEFNRIIKALSIDYKFPVAPVNAFFEANSPDSIIGHNLILEHLHPNISGYFLMTKAFYTAILKGKIITSELDSANLKNDAYYRKEWGYTELDSIVGELTVRSLKEGWPFKSKELPKRFLHDFKPANLFEKIAMKKLGSTDFSMEMAHLELAGYYEKQKNFADAYREYLALIHSIPYETEFYEKAATLLLMNGDYQQAFKLLSKSLKIYPTFFAVKWLGLIHLKSNNLKQALEYLEKAEMMSANDPQVLYNLCRIYLQTGNEPAGYELYKRLKNIAPNSAYAKDLDNRFRNE